MRQLLTFARKTDTQLEALDLGENNLNEFPPELCLPNLVRLRLTRNDLAKLPDELGQMVSLEQLLIGDNELSAIPATIGRCKNLVRLALNNNRLTIP